MRAWESETEEPPGEATACARPGVEEGLQGAQPRSSLGRQSGWAGGGRVRGAQPQLGWFSRAPVPVSALICCGVQASADLLSGQGSGPHSWVAFSTLFLPSGCPPRPPHPLSLLPARPCTQPGWAWALSSRVCRLHLLGGREPPSAAQSSVLDGACEGLVVCAPASPIPGSAGRSLCLGRTHLSQPRFSV